MVYSGKPSRACGTCRSRRIKCDEARPACGQCIQSKRECTGYRDETDLVFRDQTRKTRLKHEADRPAQDSENSHMESTVLPRSTVPRKRRAIPSSIEGLSGSDGSGSKSVIAIPREVPQYQEQQALCYFITEYVTVPQHYQRSRGYMEYLLPLYVNAADESPLLASTAATAMACFSQTPGRTMLMCEARKMYVSAVALTQKAISDPVEVKSDLTLMAVMLLGLFESFMASEDTFESWGHHANGAVAIVKLRGKEMLNNPVSAKLFWDVRTQMVIGQVARCKPVEDIFYEFDGWKYLPEDDCFGVANRLTIVTMQVPAMREVAMRILRGPMDWAIAREIVTLMEDAQRVDRELAAWSLDVPDLWRFKRLGLCKPMDDPITAQVYPGSIHGYQDIWTARHWNIYRSYRILCQAIILNCLERLIPATKIASTDEYRRTATISQNMVDDICASVPFHLGFPALTYDMKDDTSSDNSRDHSRDDNDLPRAKLFQPARFKDAQATGGYSLFWELFVAANVVVIPEAQRTWIMNRIRYIGAKYGLTQATVLASQGLQRLQGARSASFVDFAPLRDGWWEQTGGVHWRRFLDHEDGWVVDMWQGPQG